MLLINVDKIYGGGDDGYNRWKIEECFNIKVYRYKEQKKMSVTISNCDQICQSPTNSSKAKMLYTFPKGERFPRRKIIMCDRFYNTTENSPSRTTTLGFGHKYDFTKDGPKSPSPNIYNLKSDFDVDKKKGFGFGCGREEMEVTGPFVGALKNKNPGPGVYELKTTIDGSTFSMRGKNYEEDHEKLKIPGPGTYPISFAINQKGAYFLSKYKNSCVRNFKTISARGKTAQSRIPGPGAYDMAKTDLSPDGKYCISRMPSVLARRFGTSERSNIVANNYTPGPGNYKLPSQFGHYCAKNALKKPATEEVGRRTKPAEQGKQNKENAVK